MAVSRLARALAPLQAWIVGERGVLQLYTVWVGVHDLFGRMMRRDLLIALLALVAGVGAALLVLESERERTPVAVSAAVALLVGWAYIGSGLIARRQRPENRLGTVMVFIGFAWFATFLADAGSSLVFTVGLLKGPGNRAFRFPGQLPFSRDGSDGFRARMPPQARPSARVASAASTSGKSPLISGPISGPTVSAAGPVISIR